MAALRLRKEFIAFCEKGDVHNGLILCEQMKQNKMRLSGWNLNLLLNGCLKHKSVSNQYIHIWRHMVMDHQIQPNFVLYSIALRCAHICNHYEQQIQFGLELKQQYVHLMSDFHWNRIIESHFKLHHIDAALMEYQTMKSHHISPTVYTTSIMLNGLIKANAFDEFDCFLHTEVMISNECIQHRVNTLGFTNIIHGITKCGKPYLVDAIWDKMIECEIQPNINTLCVGICAAYKSRNHCLIDSFVSNIKQHFSTEMCPLVWNQIITAYGYVGHYDRMWIEYEECKSLCAVNANILTTVCSMEMRREYKQQALNEATLFIQDWRVLTPSQLKLFYRTAIQVNDVRRIEMLKRIFTDKPHLVRPVVVSAQFEYEGVVCSVQNDDCSEYNDLVDELVALVEYKSDDRQYPELNDRQSARQFIQYHAEKKALAYLLSKNAGNINIDDRQYPELNDRQSARQFIQYHAEKKALAYLLSKNAGNINIDVNMRMCEDCHRFFKHVSKYYKHITVSCADNRIKHIFKHG
eukprot:1125556_1